MGSFLDRLRSSDKNNKGREWAVFLLALVLAFSIWFLHNLSQNYTEFLSVPVIARCNIEGHSNVSSTECEITAKCTARGFAVLASRLSPNRKAVTVDFDRSILQEQNSEVFFVTSRDLVAYTNQIFTEGTSVEYVVTDTAFFRFPVVNSRMVPVSLKTNLGMKEQYALVSPPKVEPDSVLVYGEPSYVNSIEEISTQLVRFSDLASSKQGFVHLIVPGSVRLSQEQVRYSIPVTRYVTKTAHVPVRSKNVPYGKNFVIIPSSVTVNLNCVYPLTSDPFEGLVFYIDYKDFQHSRSGNCVLRASKLPDNVIGWNSDPKVFECVVDEKR